jgi:hypothetical protein
MATLDKVKMALRISTTALDEELADLIKAAEADLGIAGVVLPTELDEICDRAVITYCKLNFGLPDAVDWLKRSYDEQKAQLVTATGYTNWGDADV